MAALKSAKERGQAWRKAERVGVLIEDTAGGVLKGCAAIVTTFTFPTSDMSDVGYARRRKKASGQIFVWPASHVIGRYKEERATTILKDGSEPRRTPTIGEVEPLRVGSR